MDCGCFSDDNSFNIPFGGEPRPDARSYEGELSSGSSDTAERSAKVALLPKVKPLPKEPIKKQKDEETEEQAEFRRVPSKKKMGSSRSEEAKKFQQISSMNEESVNPGIVNLSISESQKNVAECENEAKTAKETVKTTAEVSTDVLPPETKPKSKKTGGNDSKIRLSVSMKEVKHLTEMDARSGAGNVIAESKSKASAAEGSWLSSSAKERKFASKTESLNVESKPEAEATDSSTLESKSNAAALPQQGSFRRLSKTEKNVKTESIPPEESNSEAKMGQESSLKRPQRRESKLKADGKRAESVHAPFEESSSKRGSSRRSSGRNSGQMFRESRDVDAEVTARNSAQQDTKNITENKKETQKRPDSVGITPVSTPVTDLPEGKELLTGKGSGAQEEAQKAFHQSSNDFQVNVLQDTDKRSNLIERQSLTDDPTAEAVSVADSRKMLNVEGREDVLEGKGEKKSNQIKRNSSNRKPDFVTPAVPAKVLQKGKDVRNGIQKDVQTAAETETEIKRQLPAAENATDEVHKRMSKMPDEDGLKEFNKVLQKVQNKPNGSNESTTASVEASSATKTENKIDAAMPSPTENGNIKPAKGLPVPPKANRGDASRNGLSGSQKVISGDGKSTPSAYQSANLSSGMNSHSRTASITSGEGKIQSENSEVEKSKGDVTSSSIKTKCPPPVVSRFGKVQPKGVENAKEPDTAWIGKAKRMSKDFGDKMLQKIETKAEEKKADGEVSGEFSILSFLGWFAELWDLTNWLFTSVYGLLFVGWTCRLV